MTLPKEERRRLRIEGAAHKSREARIVKTADAISKPALHGRIAAGRLAAGLAPALRRRHAGDARPDARRLPALDELFDTQEARNDHDDGEVVALLRRADSRAALTAMGTTEGF